MNAADGPARILLCEDSALYAEALTQFLERDEDLRVVGRCSRGEQLVETAARLQPDLVIIDVELPGISGVEAVERLMRVNPLPVLVLSDYAPRGSKRAAAALGAGALEARPKSELDLRGDDSAASRAFRRQLKRLSLARMSGSTRRPTRAARPAAIRGRPASLVGIGASTGGPQALERVLAGLPGDFPLPVLVVQHMSTGFTAGLVEWLNGRVRLPVRTAIDQSPVGPGVWVAPDDAHLVLDGSRRTRFDHSGPVAYHRPAVDKLFTSMAALSDSDVVGVVLTGMGRDGAGGTAAIRAAGGLTIAQDEQSSAIYGMPRAAAEVGGVVVLPLDEIAPALRSLIPARAGAR